MLDNPAFGLYVHWPFCQAKCPYCDFNSYVSGSVDQDVWIDAFKSEIDRVADKTSDRVLGTIFFGGGTPSLMEASTVKAVIDHARAAWPFSNEIEISLEANPTSVEAQRFEAYAECGVNRVSIGVQSLRDADLKTLGRLHSVEDALAALWTARRSFERVSFDIIYARQNQSLDAWREELEEALEHAPDHLSLYQLTVEQGTAFGERFSLGRLRGLPSEDLAAEMYELTQEITESAGLPAYEISNHSAPGQESRHNLIYWRNGDWAAIGPGAHGRLTLSGTRFRTETHLLPAKWLSAVQEAGTGESSSEFLSERERFEESALLGLRLTEGVPISLFEPELSLKINSLVEMGLLKVNEDRLVTSRQGRLVLNHILRELLA